MSKHAVQRRAANRVATVPWAAFGMAWAAFGLPLAWLLVDAPATAARTITVTLQPVADGEVRSGQADSVYNGTTMRIINNPVHSEASKAYLQYELPSDFAAAVSARFTTTRTVAGAWNFEYDVFGLSPGTEGTAWSDQSLTWNNAPANVTSHPYQFDSLAPHLGTFAVTGANHGGMSLESYGFGSPELNDYVNSANDGRLTLMASRAGVSTSYDVFTTSENDDYYGPTLTLTYETDPLAEPDMAAKARSHWHDWRQVQTQFPTAAWSYWARYDNEVNEFERYEAAGLNMVQVPIEYYENMSTAGLNGLIGSWQNLDLDLQKLATYIDFPVADHEGVIGYLLYDEPQPDRFDTLAAAVEMIYDTDQRGAIPMMTLLPNWAWERSSHRMNTWGSYRTYVERFADEVNPSVLYATTYPTLADGTDRLDYYANLEIIRRVSLDRGIGMMGFVIVTGHTFYRNPSESDLRWQAYSNLAYGAKGIWWYNYRIEPTGGFQEGLVYHESGEPTPVYPQVQEINSELQAIGQKLLSLHSVGVYHTGPQIPQDALRFWAEGEPGDNSALNQVVGDDFLIGEFVNMDDLADDSAYLMLVNKKHGGDFASGDPDVANQITFTIDSEYQYVYTYSPVDGEMEQLAALTEVTVDGHTLNNAFQLDFTGGQGLLLQLSKSPLLSADFNGDGRIDGADFLAWQRGESHNPFSGTDLALWESEFGNDTLAAATHVPEPSSAALLMLAAIAGALARVKPEKFQAKDE